MCQVYDHIFLFSSCSSHSSPAMTLNNLSRANAQSIAWHSSDVIMRGVLCTKTLIINNLHITKAMWMKFEKP